MFLESLKIKNFRKFGDENNIVYFVDPKSTHIQNSNGKNPFLNSVVASSTTLIIGKNNTGKTTIANALRLICENRQPKASDFNIKYLKNLFSLYKIDNFKKLPELEFYLNIKFNSNGEDLISNLNQLVTLKACKKGVLEVKIKIEITENEAFIEATKNIFKLCKKDRDQDEETSSTLDSVEVKQLFYNLLDQNSEFLKLKNNKNLFKIRVFNQNGTEVKKYCLNQLLHLHTIKANRHLKEGVLSNIFSKIVRFHLENSDSEKTALKDEIKKMNTSITSKVVQQNQNVSAILQEIETKNHVDLNLKGNITYESIVNNLIKYNFLDHGDYIPEEQFGLGYINLLNIIGEIISYIDSYNDDRYSKCINMLFIEEPEAFMHPQMQEFFINRIDNAVKKTLEIAKSTIGLNCQIVITTHSSHIINSKIHSSNSFNNINYLYEKNKRASVIKLSDDVIQGSTSEGSEEDNLKFLKKHIKYKVSELFFSDAIIFVEGVTEESLLKFYLEQDEKLKNYYISVFNINGAHGKVYFPLVKVLGIPCLVITDLDIERTKCEKGENHIKGDKDCPKCGHKRDEDDHKSIVVPIKYEQITSLQDRRTTNTTILEMYYKENINSEEKQKNNLDEITYCEDENLYLVFQKNPIRNFYATSLEEAIILENYDNRILNQVLKECKPGIYKSIVGKENSENLEELLKNSYMLQKKLADSKSIFASKLLFKCLVTDDKGKLPKLPQYIQDGFAWILSKLEKNNSL